MNSKGHNQRLTLSHLSWILAILLPLTVLVGCGDDSESEEPTTRFRITVENSSPEGLLTASDGSEHDVMLSPGLWVIHQPEFSLLVPGEALVLAELEQLAEEGDPAPALSAIEGLEDVSVGTVANMQNATYANGPIAPGQTAMTIFEAGPGDRLSLALMFAESNDVLVATPAMGIELFVDDMPVGGDVSDAFSLYDAGTELNEEPAVGPTQAARQSEAGEGTVTEEPVSVIDGEDAQGFSYPSPMSFIRVTVEVL